MKIETITTQVKTIPLKTPFITALRKVENVEFIRVKISCSNGLVAFGEAPATFAITGEDLDIISHSIVSIKEALLLLTPKEALKILHDNSMGSSAKAALDMALVSLLAQEKKMPLYKYLGATQAVTLQTDITISLNSSEIMLRDAQKAYSEGMSILKIKLGKNIEHAIRTTHMISTALTSAKLLIDANQAWSLNDTLLYINAMQNTQLELIEQPLKAIELQALKSITQVSHIPILADESAFTLKEVKEIVETKSADMINIKLMKCGGLTKAVEILEYARKYHVDCMLGSMLEGPISINATIALAMAYKDVIKYVDLDSPLLYKTPSQELEFVFEGSVIYKDSSYA